MIEKIHRISLRPSGTTTIQAGVGDNVFQSNVGAEFGLQAVIVIYIGGIPVAEVLPIAVQWEFGGASQYLSSYQPTVQAGAPNYAVNLQANPVGLFYWLPQVPAGVSTVPIMCDAEAPDGTWLQESGTLQLQANPYNYAGGAGGQIQLQALPNGNTLLSFGDSLGAGQPGIAIQYRVDVANYPGWLGAIQLVSSVRQFTGRSGRVYQLVDTGGFVLDAAATDPDFVYGKAEIEDGEIGGSYTFDDTPNQELLPTIEGDPITGFSVNETFRLTFAFNGSTTPNPSGDPSQIWFPIAPTIEWGWTATVTNNGANQWTITESTVVGPTPGGMVPPSWQGTVRAATGVDPLRRQPRRLTKKSLTAAGKP